MYCCLFLLFIKLKLIYYVNNLEKRKILALN
nr:MAG TPA: hypothetical protein [Caudoviricetes sp.]